MIKSILYAIAIPALLGFSGSVLADILADPSIDTEPLPVTTAPGQPESASEIAQNVAEATQEAERALIKATNEARQELRQAERELYQPR